MLLNMETESRGMKPNRIRQNENLSKLDGFYYHGKYYRDGVPQLAKKEQEVFPSGGTLYFDGRLKIKW